MNDQVVFCTSLIDHDKHRYQSWVDYYTEFFAGCGIDLWMINDGPTTLSIDLKGVELRTFEEKLGRETCWIFPGWKRSFYHALTWLVGKYKHIAHVESDCWITSKGRDTFLEYLRKDGYFTGYTPAYSFPEASLQIINSNSVRQYLMDKYSCRENWYEDIDFEKDLERLKPIYILDGDRIDGKFHRFNRRFTFVSSVTYEDFERLYGKDR